MTQWIDPAGNSIQFTYDNTFRLTTVTDALNQTTIISHLSNNPGVLPDYYLISRVTDPFGRSATFDYQNGQLVAIHDAIGVRCDRLPFDPPRVLALLRSSDSRQTWEKARGQGAAAATTMPSARR